MLYATALEGGSVTVATAAVVLAETVPPAVVGVHVPRRPRPAPAWAGWRVLGFMPRRRLRGGPGPVRGDRRAGPHRGAAPGQAGGRRRARPRTRLVTALTAHPDQLGTAGRGAAPVGRPLADILMARGPAASPPRTDHGSLPCCGQFITPGTHQAPFRHRGRGLQPRQGPHRLQPGPPAQAARAPGEHAEARPVPERRPGHHEPVPARGGVRHRRRHGDRPGRRPLRAVP